jgi:hypothetical protein
MFPKEYGCFPHGNGFSWDKCVGLLPKEMLCSPSLQENKVFLLGKLVKKHPKWPLFDLTKVSSWISHFDMATLTESFWWFFLLDFLLSLIYDFILE